MIKIKLKATLSVFAISGFTMVQAIELSPCRRNGQGEPCRLEITLGGTAVINSIDCDYLSAQHLKLKIKKAQADLNLLKLDEVIVSMDSIVDQVMDDVQGKMDDMNGIQNGNFSLTQIVDKVFQLIMGNGCQGEAKGQETIKAKRNLPVKLTNTDIVRDLNQLANVIKHGDTLSYILSNNAALKEAEYQKYMGQKWFDGQGVADVKTNYDNWTKQTYDNIRNTLNAAGLQATMFAKEDTRIEKFRELTNTAKGRNQLLQIANHIAGDVTEQFMKLRQLYMTDMSFRANLETVKQNKKDADRAAILNYRKTTPVPAPSADNPLDLIGN